MGRGLCPARGTAPCACGIWLDASPLVSLCTTRRTSSPWLSRRTTVRSFLAAVTRPSSCGTLSDTASTPSRARLRTRMVTASGSAACAFRLPPRTRSSCRADGTSWSRSGVCPAASSRRTWSVTVVISTASLSPLTARFARLAGRTRRRCCGIFRRGSTCTRWTRDRTSPSTRWCSRRTATGSAPPPRPRSRSGTSRASSPSLSSPPTTFRRPARSRCPSPACRCAGRPTATPSFRATPTAPSVCGPSPWLAAWGPKLLQDILLMNLKS
mmetsp:Transcript_24412/g.49617  ORF Transcript_24412/g.49617 Transcript_24412/m.49617 type:complete len:269 (+) Transcript_24412:250-1056(+)